MSLFSCPECNREISNTAISCPHCGFNIKKYRDDELANLRFEELAKQIPMPKNPLVDSYALLNYFLITLFIVIIFLFKSYITTVMTIIFALLFFGAQIVFSYIIKKQFTLYNKARKNFRAYQKEMLSNDLNNFMQKKRNAISPFHYFISFLIPLYGLIFGGSLIIKGAIRNGGICINISCLSLLLCSFILMQ